MDGAGRVGIGLLGEGEHELTPVGLRHGRESELVSGGLELR